MSSPAQHATLFVVALLGTTAQAAAEPEQTLAPCGLVSQMAMALHDEIGPGNGGVRSVLKQPYGLFETQQSDAAAKMDILEQGANRLRGLNEEAAVPGLAPLLGRLDTAVAEARASTEDLFYFRVFNKFNQVEVLSRRPLRPSYWAKLDHVDEIADQIDDLVSDTLDHNCG